MSKKAKEQIADQADESSVTETGSDQVKPQAFKSKGASGPELITLRLTAAVAIDGQVFRRDSIVHLTETEAKRLLHRGKAELATEE